MDRPPIGAGDHDLATCKGAADCSQGPLQRGDRLWLRPPIRGSLDAARASPRGQYPTCSHPQAQPLAAPRPQGQPTVGRLQGAAASGQPARGGQGCHQQGQCRWSQERLPVGKDSHRLRKGGGDDIGGQEGLG
ncbi:hypothetical protein B296_00042909 [Ensete ventricosum]|uniref:Uncharacterized protein n=1 Tax=Ensete ventricosum TaxID=4639 RepID=A0A426YCR0_ENSVE|nr:hypothetical protein B296_00042909 [Ensete ventricosum]